jgi:hypothetical protein
MNSELPVSADALLAERSRLEEELQSSEDWCELLRLKSRKDRGEGMSAVNAARLEMVLIDALADDPNFVRYKAVCVALERLIRGLPPLLPARSKPDIERDDLTKIRGITASMERRLNALDVTTFAQIADWRAADIQSMSADLGIGKQIYAQNWIEQAALLAKPQPPKSSASAAAASEPATKLNRPAPLPVPPPAIEQFVQPVSVPEASAEKTAAVPLSRVAAVQAILREVLPAATNETTTAPVEPEAAKPPITKHALHARADHVPVSDLASEQVVSKAAPQIASQDASQAPAPSDTPSVTVSTAHPAAASVRPPPAPEPAAPAVDTAAAKPAVLSAQNVEKLALDSIVAKPVAPLPVPPVPLRADKYGKAPVETEVLGKSGVAGSPDGGLQTPTAAVVAVPVPERPLPMPPMPLRVQLLPRVGDVQGDVLSKSDAKPDVRLAATVDAKTSATPETHLPAPPRPLVVTRSSLPLRPAEPPAQTAEAVKSRGPLPIVPVQPSPEQTSAQTLASPMPATSIPASAGAVPAMSIAEAIAYAAEVARQGPRQPPTTTPSVVRDAPVAAKPAPPPKAPVAPSLPAGAAKVAVAAAPIVPPPLPEGFAPPPEAAPPEAAMGHVRSTTVHAPRFVEREDLAGYRLSAEEATVEIIVKSPSEPPPPRVALAKVSAETTSPVPRAATPIGRFLKALTGN